MLVSQGNRGLYRVGLSWLMLPSPMTSITVPLKGTCLKADGAAKSHVPRIIGFPFRTCRVRNSRTGLVGYCGVWTKRVSFSLSAVTSGARPDWSVSRWVQECRALLLRTLNNWIVPL